MTSKRPAPDPESLRDEHLLAALRHVPEYQDNAPAALSARISAAAHLAAAGSRDRSQAALGMQATPSPASHQTESTGFNEWLRRWFGSPYAFAGAGTAMAGLLVGTVLWVGRDEWPQHAQNHPSTAAAQAEIKQAADAPSAASAPMDVSAGAPQLGLSRSPDTDSPPDASRGQVTSTAESHPAPTYRVQRQRRGSEDVANGRQLPTPSETPSPLHKSAIPKPIQEDTASTVASSTPRAPTPPVAIQAAAPSVMASATPLPAESSAAAPPSSLLTAKATASRQASPASRQEATAEERATAAALVARSAGTLAFSMASPESPTRASGTGAWLRVVATRATHWQLGEATPQVWRSSPHGEWLSSLAMAIGERGREAPDEAPPGVLDTVQLNRVDRIIGRLWLTESLLRWCDEQGKCREANVEPPRMQELRSALPR